MNGEEDAADRKRRGAEEKKNEQKERWESESEVIVFFTQVIPGSVRPDRLYILFVSLQHLNKPEELVNLMMAHLLCSVNIAPSPSLLLHLAGSNWDIDNKA